LRRALQKYIEDPLSEALIQGSLARPADFEVFLASDGIYCRQLVEEPVVAGEGGGTAEAVAPPPAIALYTFE
jgi:ATP-dependent Clp protease ATP-binding subunit ClpC